MLSFVTGRSLLESVFWLLMRLRLRFILDRSLSKTSPDLRADTRSSNSPPSSSPLAFALRALRSRSLCSLSYGTEDGVRTELLLGSASYRNEKKKVGNYSVNANTDLRSGLGLHLVFTPQLIKLRSYEKQEPFTYLSFHFGPALLLLFTLSHVLVLLPGF